MDDSAHQRQQSGIQQQTHHSPHEEGPTSIADLELRTLISSIAFPFPYIKKLPWAALSTAPQTPPKPTYASDNLLTSGGQFTKTDAFTMDLQLEDHDVIDSDVDSDDLEIVYYKANTGFSPSCGLCRFDFRIDDTVVVCMLPCPANEMVRF